VNPLRTFVNNYLTTRRAMGYKLERAGRLLPQFVDYLDDAGTATVTVEHAVTWATLPTGTKQTWWAERLSIVRGFATWLAAFEPATEIPPLDLLPRASGRTTPYICSQPEIDALLEAARRIPTPLRAATYQTLIGLLAVTGMRIGEAIALDRADLDRAHGLLEVRSGKFGKSRQLPLHKTAIAALEGYLRVRDRLRRDVHTSALLISNVGTRLDYRYVNKTFRQLADRAGLTPRSPSCRPRLHSLRHSFAVHTVLDGYRTGADVQAMLPLLSTYLGHVEPSNTYWYLEAAPELLALAGQASRTTSGATDERARPDPAGVLHRPARASTPRQPSHHRRLPRWSQAAGRVRCPTGRHHPLGPRHRRSQRRHGCGVPRSSRA
jgi:integrase/recombinase XerD